MKKPVQRLDPVAAFAAGLAWAVWLWAIEQAAAEAEPVVVGEEVVSLDEEMCVMRARSERAREELRRQIAEAAERDARGEQ